MEVIILAGGLGTRLREVVSDLPKPMALVNEKPFLHYVLSWLNRYPISKIILAVGYKPEVITDYFGDTFNSINLEYSRERSPLGTGGAIKQALGYTSAENILIVNGDTFFPIDIHRFYDFHIKNNAFLSVALKKMTDIDRYGSVVCRDNTIIEFREKKKLSEGLINGGIYLVNRKMMLEMTLPDVFSFEKEVLEKQAGSPGLAGLIFDDDFIDIGVPGDYYRAGLFLATSSGRTK